MVESNEFSLRQRGNPRVPSPSNPTQQGYSPREDFLFDEEKNSWQLQRTAMSSSFRQRGYPHEKNNLVGEGGGTMKITSLSMTDISDSLLRFPP